jgi:hypothetical protein
MSTVILHKDPTKNLCNLYIDKNSGGRWNEMMERPPLKRINKKATLSH